MSVDIVVLKKFCAPAGTRSKGGGESPLTRPWSDEIFSYFSDGHILLRVPRIAEIVETDGPDAARVIAGTIPVTWHALGGVWSSLAQCARCAGSGSVLACPECDGLGRVEVYSGYNYYEFRCKSCDGIGNCDEPFTCPGCAGYGIENPREAIKIGGSFFGAGLLQRLLRSFPDARVGVAGGERPALISFEGGDGVIMPMRVFT